MQQLLRTKKYSPDALFAQFLHRFVLEEVVGKIFTLHAVYIYVLVDWGPHNYSSISISYFHLSSKDSTSKPILTKTQSGDTLLLQIHEQSMNQVSLKI